jgi:hypothetical protein
MLNCCRSHKAELALTLSFCMISALGVAAVYQGWNGPSTFMAFGRCTVFVAFMATVHLIGYRLWRRQFTHGQDSGNQLPATPIVPVYRAPIRSALLQQSVVLILAALMLDGGLTFNMAVIAIVAYWLAVGVILARRPGSPTRADILLIRYGFLLVFGVVLVTAPIVWTALGRL